MGRRVAGRGAEVCVILLTGGSGLLGRELRKHLDVLAPSHAEFDVTWGDLRLPDGVGCIVHAAAWTDLASAQKQPADCYAVNVLGTERVARLGVPLIYISTEYVFDGTQGNYREADPPNPLNYYALSKALGEQAARLAPRSLVIRCIFKPRPFEHPRAFTDQWSSGDYVDVIAPLIAGVIKRRDQFADHDTIHVGTGRKRIYDLARQSRPVQPATRDEVALRLPRDTSLNMEKYAACLAR